MTLIPDIQDSHPLADDILNLRNQGYSVNYIKNHCKSEGYPYSVTQIKKYLASKEPPKPVDDSEESEKPKKKSKQPVVIDLDGLAKRFDIPDDLTDPDTLMGTLQKLSAYTAVLQFQILIGKLEAHARDEISYPTDQAKGLRLIIECFTKLWGYDNAVNLTTAMRTLEAQGYKIDAVNLVEDSLERDKKTNLEESE